MLALLPLVVVTAVTAAPASPVRVLVLDMEAIGVDPSVSRSIDALVLQGAAGDGVEVIAQAEIQKLAEVDAAKQDLDCNASSCLAELAGAMGAQLVLFGSVSQLGETVTVSLSLFDQKTAQIGRDSVTTKNVGSLPLKLPPRVRALVNAHVPGGSSVRPATETKKAGPSPLVIVGVGAVGVGAALVVGGAIGTGVMEAQIQDPAALGTVKESSQTVGKITIAIVALGALLGGGGAVAFMMGLE